jgi:hypothetical protein
LAQGQPRFILAINKMPLVPVKVSITLMVPPTGNLWLAVSSRQKATRNKIGQLRALIDGYAWDEMHY